MRATKKLRNLERSLEDRIAQIERQIDSAVDNAAWFELIDRRNVLVSKLAIVRWKMSGRVRP